MSRRVPPGRRARLRAVAPGDERLEPFGWVRQGENPVGFNDGAVDARGRFWAGPCERDTTTASTALTGRLGLGDGHGVRRPQRDRWSPDARTMYFTDSADSKIFAYTFELETGRIGDRRIWAESRPVRASQTASPSTRRLRLERPLEARGCVERGTARRVGCSRTLLSRPRFPHAVAFGGEAGATSTSPRRYLKCPTPNGKQALRRRPVSL
jgi:hypothetical protein